MIRSRILTGSIFQLLLAPEGKGGGGVVKTIEEQLTDAKANLVTMQTQVTSLTSERDSARTDLQTAQAEVTRLTGQFNSATTAATTAQAEVTRLTSELATMTSARDGLQTQLTSATANVGRLEKLCGLHGVNPNEAVPSESESTTSNSLLDKFMKASAGEKTAMIKSDGTALFAEAKARGIKIG